MAVPAGVLTVSALLLLTGCHEQTSQTTASTNASGTNSAEAQAETGGESVAPPEPPQPPSREVLARTEVNPRQAVTGEVNAFLTGELRTFIAQKNRMPATFAELARARLDSVPRPPAGKKWVIDSETQEVKAVASP